MNITKAFLFTILLFILEVVIVVIADFLLGYDIIQTNAIEHYMGIINIIPSCIAFSVVLFVIFKMNIKREDIAKKVNDIEWKIVLLLLILNVGMFFFDRPCFDFTRMLDVINKVEIAPYMNYSGSNLSLFYKCVSVVIVAPVFEELFFRKYLFVELYKKYSFRISIIVSSICFSLIHLPSYRNLIPTFLFGIICCIIYTKTKNILYTIILHSISNLTWIFTILYGEVFFNWMISLKFNWIYWSMVASGILIVLYGLKYLRKITNKGKVII